MSPVNSRLDLLKASLHRVEMLFCASQESRIRGFTFLKGHTMVSLA